MHPHLTRSAFALCLLASCALAGPATAAVQMPGGGSIEQVDFERHIMGLLGRFGCASGSCHGSFQGKGGLQLSLFGYEPAMDYQNLVRASNGRRIDLADPDLSLMLLKATGQISHEGRTRFSKNSWAADLVRAWIAQGAKRTPGSGTVKTLTVKPAEYAFGKAGQSGQLRVEALFADGTKEDITPLCEFRTNDDSVAEVSNLGVVRAVRPGDTAIVVSYRGNVTPVRVLVPADTKPGFVYPNVPASNYIDSEVLAKLRRLNMVPSELSSDGEFLRRVTLDTIGTLPTPDEVRAFLADRSPDKREKKIDQLLAQPMHAALWATKFCDITGNNTDALEQPQQRKMYLSQMWHDWFRKRLAENMPYDDLVKNILTATSREGRSAEDYIKEVESWETAQDASKKTNYADRQTLDLFWRRQAAVTTDIWGEKTAAAFLGVRLECAQCHKHPFDRWTQTDYRAYANIFATVSFNAAKGAAGPNGAFAKANKERQAKNRMLQQQKGRKGIPLFVLREVFVADRANPRALLKDPETNTPLSPRALGGPEILAKNGTDPRADLVEWMRSANNPFFARSFANRVWGHYLGVGIVHPVDDFSLANPPSNPKLLDALAADFVAGKYDIRKLEKTILMSRTYQASSMPNETNRFDKVNYARSYIRPLMAEVVVDMLNAALGTSEKWNAAEAPAGARAIEVGASRVQNPNVNYVFRVFGRPPRTTACDCERAMDPALPQKLYLLADGTLQDKLKESKNRVADVLKQKADDLEALEELFLATLGRAPTEGDRQWFLAYKAKKDALPRRQLFNDALWALLNTTEFIFNH
jgi:hypothetical protein